MQAADVIVKAIDKKEEEINAIVIAAGDNIEFEDDTNCHARRKTKKQHYSEFVENF